MRRGAIVGIVVAVGIVGIVLLGLATALADPIRREARLDLADWPAGARPLRVALLSDIHMGPPMMDGERLARTVAQVNAARPDLVLIAGDFINGHGPSGAAARAAGLTRPLSGLRPPLGTVAVMGNHDHWTDAAAITGALRAAGVTVVENQAVQRGPVTVIGVGDGFSGHAAVGAAIASGRRLRGPKLVLTHSPDIAGSLPSGAALLLAGHTHCGQIVLPLIGPVLRHAPHLGWKRLYDPRYRCGLIRSGSVPVLVTAGIGAGTLPIRIGAAPDWWLVTLGPRRKLS